MGIEDTFSVQLLVLNLNVGFDKNITVDYLIKMEDYESIEISNPPRISYINFFLIYLEFKE